MKIIVTGATGLLGRALMTGLAEHDVVGLSRTAVGDCLRQGDVRDLQFVRDILRSVAPDAVIHAAGERGRSAITFEPEAAWETNVVGARNVAVVCDEVNAFFLLISSDAVFDGARPPYHPDDRPGPVNAYGRMKIEAERATREANPSTAILRLPLLYGAVTSLDETSVTALAPPLLRGEALEADDLCVRYPTHAADAAEACRHLVTDHAEPAQTCHWTGEEAHTKFSMANVIADVVDAPRSLIKPVLTDHDLPRDAHLARSPMHLHRAGSTSFRKGIEDVLAPFLA